MRIVLGLGRSVLLGRQVAADRDVQQRHVLAAAHVIAAVAAAGEKVTASYGCADPDGLVSRSLQGALAEALPGRAVRVLRTGREINDLDAIRTLLAADTVVVCANPAAKDDDLAGALLAIGLRADRFVMLTDVAGVFADWPAQRRMIRAASPDILSPDKFAVGTMRPKLEAACCFAARTGGAAAIGALADTQGLLDGTAGTTIAAGAGRMMLYSTPISRGAPAPELA
jgi:carbamate kinase